MRRILVDLYSINANQDWMTASYIQCLPEEFLHELALDVFATRPIPQGLPGTQLRRDGGLAYVETEEATST